MDFLSLITRLLESQLSHFSVHLIVYLPILYFITREDVIGYSNKMLVKAKVKNIQYIL